MVIIAIKGGSILSVGNGTFLIDRIQTAGPGQLNIPQEKIYELGNYKSVATVRDTPDLSFSIESFDVSTEVENMVTGGTGNFATGVDLATCVPVDMSSMFKGGLGVASPYAVISSVALPFLYLESASYRFGVGENSTQTFSMKGDSIFYNPGPTYVQLANASGAAGQTVTTTNPAYSVAEGDNRRVLSVTVNNIRLALGADYTETYGAPFTPPAAPGLTTATTGGSVAAGTYTVKISYLTADGETLPSASSTITTTGATSTITIASPAAQTGATGWYAYVSQAGGTTLTRQQAGAATAIGTGLTLTTPPTTTGVAPKTTAPTSGSAIVTITLIKAHTAGTNNIRIMYSSPTALSFAQASHPDTTVKPAAVRGRDVDIYVGGYNAADPSSSAANKIVSVQNVTVDWRVTIDRDEEMGNLYLVGQDFEVPDVSGNLSIKPRTPEELATLIRKVQGVTDATRVLGPQTAVPLALDVVIHTPGSTAVQKRLHVPDARFSLPGFSGRVQTKTTWDLAWTSDGGTLLIFNT